VYLEDFGETVQNPKTLIPSKPAPLEFKSST